MDVYEIDTASFDAETKPELFGRMIELVGDTAVRLAFISSAWALERGAMTPQQFEAESRVWADHLDEHPNRVEMLTVYVTDSEQELFWAAEINRHADRPPTLGQWGPTEIGGRLTGLRGALRAEPQL